MARNVGTSTVGLESMNRHRHGSHDGRYRRHLPSQPDECHDHIESGGDAARLESSARHVERRVLQGVGISLRQDRAKVMYSYQRVPRSQHYGASSMDCQAQENCPQSQPTGHLYERSAGLSRICISVNKLHTFGLKDGCSSITELLRNFCTRQSRP